LLGHAEVNDVNDVGSFRVGPAYQKVVGLDVSIDQVLFVDSLYSRKLKNVSTCTSKASGHIHHLLRDHNDGLDGELPITVVEEVFQART